MKAKHKYNSKTPEGARRIAQSMGYKHTIYDEPKMIQLLARAGIHLDGIDYSNKTTYVDDMPFESNPDLVADSTETIKL
jgi:hypothetical protein